MNETLLSTFTLLTAFGLAGLGFIFLMKKPIAFDISGHAEKGLPPVMGGRYLMMTFLIAGFWAMKDARALALVFLIIGLAAALDAVIEPQHGGKFLPHALFSAGTLILSYFYWSAYRGGEI